MSLDSSHTYLHLHGAWHSTLLESFTHAASSRLAPDEIYLTPSAQPVDPEDEDDIVPDMHAAFGIQRATRPQRKSAWRDWGLEGLLVGETGGEVRGRPVTAAAERGAGQASRGHGVSGNGDGNVQTLRVRRRVEGSVGGRLRS